MNENYLTEKSRNFSTLETLFFFFFGCGIDHGLCTGQGALFIWRSLLFTHPLIPLISIYLIYIERKGIFAEVNYLFVVGIPVLLLGIALFVVGFLWGATLDENDYASFITFSTFIFINGAFILLYGMQAYRSACSLFSFDFCVPIPTAIMDNIVLFLQIGSTKFTNLLFLASGVPFVRDGFVFHLTNISVEVAKHAVASGQAWLFLLSLFWPVICFWNPTGKNFPCCLRSVDCHV